MSITEKAIIRSKCVFSKDRKHKYLLNIEWDEKKPKAVVIMIYPSISDCVVMDLTTSLVINNMYKLGYGAVNIVNIYSKINATTIVEDEKEAEFNKENISTIAKCVADESNSIAIIAWGSCGNGNKRVKKIQENILEILEVHKEKLHVIQDGRGKKGLHPLTPSVRNGWIVVPYELEFNKDKKDSEDSPAGEEAKEDKKESEKIINEKV